MGHCTSKDQKEGKRLNRRIDEQIKKDQSMSLRIIKLFINTLIPSLSHLSLLLFCVNKSDTVRLTVTKKVPFHFDSKKSKLEMPSTKL
ncbi:hypothetical protein ANCCEY_00538 [Ancylostoma ceylanicum]|uniref:Uncharacterized protein n=1 Tax=Ancylostoma ceylanicum TaxID=53326 RepID=A0A0D6MBK7_9BILA|nr:hypothetical protein ANCCEY_00538 [Ancylostoma ceylanicum]